jgi:RecQ family ATP-dependent DNA helicase
MVDEQLIVATMTAASLDSFVVRKERRSAYKDALECLQAVFGYDAFRPGQRPVIDAVLDERCDAFVLWSTGSGKSLTFQIPALMFPGVTIVVSPLIALMSDQVRALKARRVAAECYNSSQKQSEQRSILDAVQKGDVKLLYVSPERAVTAQFLNLLAALHAKGRLSLFAVDESHCVSSWGHDFRPSYRRLAVLKQRFATVPMLALTATATPAVVEDVLSQLQLRSPRVFRQSFNRPNVVYDVVCVGVAEQAHGSLFADLSLRLAAIRERSAANSASTLPRVAGIVYCHKRDDCDAFAERLSAAGLRAAAYHSTTKKRDQVLADWTAGKIDIAVATIAFGMGIDKADVRFVVHLNVSKSLEAFYQESGRAGRDGKPSWSILYVAKDDLDMQRFLISKDGGRVAAEYDDDGQTVGGVQSSADAQARQQRQLKALDEVVKYTQPKCRRATLLAHFGEVLASGGAAGNNGGAPCCDYCTAPAKVKKEFATQQRLDTDAGTGASSFAASFGGGGKTVSTTTGFVRLSEFAGARSVEDTDDFYDEDPDKPKRVDLSKARDKWAALEAAESEWNDSRSSSTTSRLGFTRASASSIGGGGGGFRAPRAATTSAAASDGGFSSALRLMRDAAGPLYKASSTAKSSAPISVSAAAAPPKRALEAPQSSTKRARNSAAVSAPKTPPPTLDLTDEADDGADGEWVN